MLEIKILVFKLLTVDGCAACAVPVQEIAAWVGVGGQLMAWPVRTSTSLAP